MLLRRQAGTQAQRRTLPVAISLGLRADGHHTGTRPTAAQVGEDWRYYAEERAGEGNTRSESADKPGYADAADGEEIESVVCVSFF